MCDDNREPWGIDAINSAPVPVAFATNAGFPGAQCISTTLDATVFAGKPGGVDPYQDHDGAAPVRRLATESKGLDGESHEDRPVRFTKIIVIINKCFVSLRVCGNISAFGSVSNKINKKFGKNQRESG
jgi:hypothetical protein